MISRTDDCPNDLVSDRFNNRALTVLTSLIGASTVMLYMVIQFYAIADLLPAMSRGESGSEILGTVCQPRNALNSVART
jgi:Na+/proline symporter